MSKLSLGFKACETNLPLLPDGRLGAAAGLLDSGLLLCGGLREGKTASNNCWLLRLGSNEWQAADSLPQPTAFPAYAVLSNRLYVAGGVTSLHAPALNTVQAYSTKAGWTTLPPLPTPRYGGCALAHPGDATDPTGYLLVVGGWDPEHMNHVENVQAKVEVYSATRRRWKGLDVVEEEKAWMGGMGMSCTTGSGPLDTASIALAGGVVYKRVDDELVIWPVSSLTRLYFNGTRMPVDTFPSPEVVLQPGLGWLDGSLVVAGTRQGKLLKSEEGGNGWEEVDTGKGLIREMASHVVLRGQSAFAASCQESQQR